MGNQTIQKINPCSDKFIEDFKSSTKHTPRKISSSIKLQRTKSQNTPISVSNHSNFLLQNTKCHQNQQTFSTDSSLSKKSKFNSSPSSQKIEILDQMSPINFKYSDEAPQIKKIFIFDWDDTLFFSSHIRQKKCSIKNFKENKNVLEKFDNLVNKILQACIQIGEVYIVTNSRQGWVQYSSELFLPKTSQTIFKNGKIKVISSRPNMEEFFLCNTAQKWKYATFKDIMSQQIKKLSQRTLQNTCLHLICIGDSQQQIQATNQIYEEYEDNFRNLYTKTIKLQDFPNIEDLMQQQQLLYKQLQMISNVDKKLVIKLKRPKEVREINIAQ